MRQSGKCRTNGEFYIFVKYVEVRKMLTMVYFSILTPSPTNSNIIQIDVRFQMNL